jgi:hypothetical protein
MCDDSVAVDIFKIRCTLDADATAVPNLRMQERCSTQHPGKIGGRAQMEERGSSDGRKMDSHASPSGSSPPRGGPLAPPSRHSNGGRTHNGHRQAGRHGGHHGRAQQSTVGLGIIRPQEVLSAAAYAERGEGKGGAACELWTRARAEDEGAPASRRNASIP